MFPRVAWLATFLVIVLLGGGSCDKLNERRILLPYNSGVPSNFTLEALSSSSCYKWSSSRPEIVSLTVIGDPACSTKAIVSVTSQIPKRQSSVVTARDVKTNLQIRCDVEVDVISRIAITTTTHEIVLGELPEMVKVLAYTEKGDVFSSMGGIQMNWLVEPNDILRYRFWSTTSYSSPDFVNFWEQRGSKSSYVLMEGVQTGTAKVEARVVDPAYAQVEASSVNFHVVANLVLSPSNDLFIIRGTKVEFKAEIVKQNSKTLLNLPMPQYFIEVADSDIASFEESNMLLTALEEGQTSLLLRDQNPNGESLSMTSIDVHVMKPSYIAIHIGNEEPPFLKTDFEYTVTLTMHSSSHHNLFISHNLRFAADFPEEFFDVLEVSTNGTFYRVKTKKTGNCNIKAHYLGTEELLLDSPTLNIGQDVGIYNALSVNPSRLILPYLERHSLNYTIEFEARGGTGDYLWEMEHESKASFSFQRDRSSKLTLYHRGAPGEVSLFCSDVLSPSTFNARAEVHLVQVEEIEVLPSIIEAEIGQSVNIPISLLGSVAGEKVVFDSCDQLDFIVDVAEKDRVEYLPDFVNGLGEKSCRSLLFKCNKQGTSRVWMSIGDIQASFFVGCHAPLQLLHPTDTAYLALGASIDVAFEGGHDAWSLFPEGHFRSTQIVGFGGDESGLQVQEIRSRFKDRYIYRVGCLRYGEGEFELIVGNSISVTLPHPGVSRASVKIFCVKPSSMNIRPKLKSTCPLSKSVFPVERDQDTQIDVNVFDEHGNRFYNFSTLFLKWARSGSGALSEDPAISEDVLASDSGYAVLQRSFKTLKKSQEKTQSIKAKIFGYRDSNYRDTFDISAQVDILVTDAPSVAENPISILMEANNKKFLQISGGSGYFYVDSFGDENVEIESESGQKRFSLIPKRVGSDSMEIVDLCLNFPPLVLSFSVVTAAQIQVNIIDKIELGTEVEGTFFVLDNRGNKVESSLYSLFNFSVQAWNNLEISGIRPKDQYSSVFRVRALKVGDTKIAVKSNAPSLSTLRSSPVEIQIFSPLSIYPKNILMILGNQFQVSITGGPETSRNFKYSIENTNVASVESNGLINALKLGKTVLTVKILNVNNFEYSRAQVDVDVVPLSQIKIFSPINHILAGSSVPLHLLGNNFEHETPMMFGMATPSLRIQWSISNENVASLSSSFQHLGIVDKNSDIFSTRLIARSPGAVDVTVRVESNLRGQIENNVVLEHTVHINVYPPFSPIFSSNNHESHMDSRVLLLSPNSELKLHSDHVDDITYQILNGTQVSLVNETGISLQAGDLPELARLVVYRNVHKSGVLEYYNYAIHVDRVHYLSLEFAEQKPVSGQMIDTFPLGSEIQFDVVFYDNHGRKFDAVRSSLVTHINRHNVIAVMRGATENSFTIHAVQEGSVILHVLDEINNVGTYYKINVGSIVQPGFDMLAPLRVGDIVCFRCSMTPEQNAQTWSIEHTDLNPPGVITQNGIFVALHAGKANLIFETDIAGVKTQNTLNIKKMKAITLDAKSHRGITTTSSLMVDINVVDGQSFRSCNNEAEINTAIAELTLRRKLPFTCDVEFSNSALASLWRASVGFSVSRNRWYCSFTPKEDVDESSFETLSMFNVNVILKVMTNVVNIQDAQILDPSDIGYDQLEVPFLLPFQMSIKTVIFTSEIRTVVFTVTSAEIVLHELQIISSNRDLMETEKTEIVNNTLKVTIVLKDPNSFFADDVASLHLLFRSELTNQTERVPVKIKLFGSLYDLQLKNFPNILNLLYTIGIAIIAGILTIWASVTFTKKSTFKSEEYQRQNLYSDQTDSSFRSSFINRQGMGSDTPRSSNDFATSRSPSTMNSPRSPNTTPGRPLYSKILKDNY